MSQATTRTEELGLNTSELLRAIAEGPRPPAPLPRQMFPKHDVLDVGRLNELAEILRRPIETPAIGEHAAKAMLNVAETVARDVMAIAEDHMDRALALKREAENFASIVRDYGGVLGDRIRSESIRGLKVSECMRAAREIIGESMPTDHIGQPGAGEGEAPTGTA